MLSSKTFKEHFDQEACSFGALGVMLEANCVFPNEETAREFTQLRDEIDALKAMKTSGPQAAKREDFKAKLESAYSIVCVPFRSRRGLA